MIVNGTNLSMTRGDSETITVSLESYVFTDADRVEMTVRKQAQASTVLMHKVAEIIDGEAIIEIKSEDTSAMRFGEYVYDIQWTDGEGSVTTIIKPSKFEVTEEVTYGDYQN